MIAIIYKEIIKLKKGSLLKEKNIIYFKGDKDDNTGHAHTDRIQC